MARVIGISGAHGGGKSTVLEALRRDGYLVDDFKVSREVQKQLSWENLDSVMDDVASMCAFQEEVLIQKLKQDSNLRFVVDNKFIFTERTFADIAAYATHWAWKHVDRNNWEVEDAIVWLAQYCKKCIEAQKLVYSGVVLLPFMPHMKWQNDPARASKSTVEGIFEDIQRFGEQRELLLLKKMTLTEQTVEGRKNEIISFLEKV